MAKIVETRNVTCRYGRDNVVIQEYNKFGWTFISRRLLNRNGIEFAPGERLGWNDDLHECSLAILFKREVEQSASIELDRLQYEYLSLAPVSEKFDGGCLSGAIVFGLVAVGLAIAGFAFIADFFGYILLLIGLAFSIPVPAFIIIGCKHQSKAKQKNKVRLVRREEIMDRVRTLLSY